MDLFGHLDRYDYGEVHLKLDKATGLRAIVAIHDTRLGPSLGGCRFIHYDSDEAAVVDALRLARGMTYKAALAGLPHGGGKSVIMLPSQHFDRVALFRAFGKFIDDLRGHYITAEDSGTGLEDMEVIRSVTKWVTGVDPSHGGSGDPSPFTALGVRRGIEACVEHKLGRATLAGVHVVVQGVGHVGYHLCKELHEQGAKLTVADVDPLKAERAHRELGAKLVPLEGIFDVDCDVFAPCALEQVVTEENAADVKAKVIVEGANGPLTPAADDILESNGVLILPDVLANAGGVVVSYFEWVQGLQEYFWKEDEVNARLNEIVRRAFDETWSTYTDRKVSMRMAAYGLAVQRVAEATVTRGLYP